MDNITPSFQKIKVDEDRAFYVKVSDPASAAPIGTIILQHGRGGHMDSPHNTAITEKFLENNYRVIGINSQNSYPPNQSSGDMNQFTIQEHVDDMAQTIDWAKDTNKIIGPLMLGGHSMGAYSAIQLSLTDYWNDVSAVFAFAPVISGQQQIDSKVLAQPENMQNGFFEEVDGGVTYRITKEMMDEWAMHDLYPVPHYIKSDIHIIAAENDSSVLPKNVEKFYNKLPDGRASLSWIKDSEHGFSGHLDELKKATQTAINRYNHKDSSYTPEPQ